MRSLAASRARAAACALCAALAGAAATAADDRYDSARAAAQSAQDLQDQGQWAAAQATLEAASARCGDADAGRSCRLLVLYSQGYLAQREALRRPDAAAALLATAADRYAAVLAVAPAHEATLKNLALVDLGLDRTDAAEAVLKTAVAADRSGTGRAALQLGQLYRDTGRFDEALAAFESAGAAAPTDPAPREAIVALYATVPERAPALMDKLVAWEPVFPAVADTGYRQILAQAPQTELGERAVVNWVSLVARQGWVSPSTFAGLPMAWAPVAEAARFVADPETAIPGGGWWGSRPLRRSVLAQLSLVAATAPAAQADPRRALRRLQVGLQVCPGYEEYQYDLQMKAAWPTRMELARATLSLLSRQPELDPGEKLQRWLILELFQGKAGAYRSQDLAAMQRFHTTLGRWYAARGEWSPDTHAGYGGGSASSTNALFQLEQAIADAGQRAARGEPYQPLQLEKALLATGYEKVGKPAQARSTYLDAAAAFLDTDDLDAARDALQAARRLGATPGGTGDGATADLLQRIVATRQALAADSVPPDFETLAGQRWLDQPLTLSVAPRQRFKTLADLALRAREDGQAELAVARAGLAFETSLSLKSLVGTADLVRLQQVQALTTARANLGERGTAQVTPVRAAAEGGKAWGLYVPAASQSNYVVVGSDALLAGQIDARIRASAALAGKVSGFKVEAGKVDLYIPAADDAAAKAAHQLTDLQGVRSLLVIG